MTTALEIDQNETKVRVLFCTVQKETGVDVDIFLCDEEFKPVGAPTIGTSHQDEVTYHTELRKQAKERNQFIPDFSTNPELNEN